jgi:transposase-like protein
MISLNKTKHKNGTEAASKHERFCPICNKQVFGSSYKFNSHLYQHEAIAARFTCPYCSKQYFRKDIYTKHLEVHTGRKKKYICDYCDRDFVDKRSLIVHLKVHDDSTSKLIGFSCLACGVKYCEERLLKYHIRKEHFNLQPKDQVAGVSSVVKKPINETWVERVMETEVCVEMTKVNDKVITIKKCKTVKNEHQNNADNKNTFTDYINSVFASKDKSQYSKAVCDYCNKEMLKKSLRNHIRERHLKV